MNVESVTRDGQYSFAVFHRPHIRRTSLLLLAGALSLMIIIVAVTVRPDQVQDKVQATVEEPTVVSTFTSIDCDAFGADTKYFTHIVNNMANHQPRRCITGDQGRRNCKCASPKDASPNKWNPEWTSVFTRNVQLLQDQGNNQHLDVLMLGDSLVEHWLGTNNSHARSKVTGHKAWSDIHALYQQYFRSTNSTTGERPIRGLALGIAQDGYSPLLYRIQNGELPSQLKVPIIWINIGIHDLYSYDCTADSVVAGHLAIVDAIQQIRSNHDQPTRIVLNSLVPIDDDADSSEAITQVNERLHCYAQQNPNVDFFDATSLLTVMNGNVSQANLDLFADDGITLNAKGYTVWGEAIVHRVLHILEEEGL